MSTRTGARRQVSQSHRRRPQTAVRGRLGFAGTVSKGSEQAAGLATLHGDEFGGGPTVPMVPGTWGGDPEALGDPGDGRDET